MLSGEPGFAALALMLFLWARHHLRRSPGPPGAAAATELR
jgi:hypothetical protein